MLVRGMHFGIQRDEEKRKNKEIVIGYLTDHLKVSFIKFHYKFHHRIKTNFQRRCLAHAYNSQELFAYSNIALEISIKRSEQFASMVYGLLLVFDLDVLLSYVCQR